MAARQGINDTDPQAEAVQIEILRKMSPARRLRLAASLNETCRKLALAGLRRRNPGASEEDLARMLARQLLGEALSEKVNRERAKRAKE